MVRRMTRPARPMVSMGALPGGFYDADITFFWKE